ncbi:hypothetical protein GCM10018966_025720 [Streptomyces yanii]
MSSVSDEDALRRAAVRLVDFVFGDDMSYFDSLPPDVEVEIGSPLGMVAVALEEGHEVSELRDAARLLHSCTAGVLSSIPRELFDMISELRLFAR